MNTLSEILSSKVRSEVFRLLFGLNIGPLHVREIQRRSGFAIGTIQTEMKKLHKLDLVIKRKDGNRVYYSANQLNPIFPEIHALVIKTVGLADILKNALGSEKNIYVAFVFGSLSRNSEKAESDIDLMAIGHIGLRSLSGMLNGISEKVGREINPYILTPKEYNIRKSQNEHFLSRVLNEPKLFIIGNDHDLETMGK